jgi:hypothetical protein
MSRRCGVFDLGSVSTLQHDRGRQLDADRAPVVEVDLDSVLGIR